MTEKEKEILKVEEGFKENIEKDLEKENTENQKLEIVDIKFVGNVIWKDKINGKEVFEKLFIVDLKKTEITDQKTKREVNLSRYYLGNNCIAADLGNNIPEFSQNFAIAEKHKLDAVKELVEKTSNKDLEKNSLNNLKEKELKEVLSTYVGKNLSDEEIEKIKGVKEDKEQTKEEIKKQKEDKNELTKKQSEKIKVNGIEEVDLNKKVDGKQTLGDRLDLKEFDSLYVIYSERATEIKKNEKINNTAYSIVGIRKDGTAKVLNDEFEIDKSMR